MGKLCTFGMVLVSLFLVGCKIKIVVPEGGDVITESGSYECLSGKTCHIEVVDFFFDETFIAKPATGYKFRFWKRGKNRLCGWNKKPCHLHTAGFDENAELAEVILSFLESDEIFYLQPVFEPPIDADIRILLYDFRFSWLYCKQQGTIHYEVGIRNLGPADAKDIVVSLKEELFITPGWKTNYGACTSVPGEISCRLSRDIPAGDVAWFDFYSDYFQNKATRIHQVTFGVSSSSEDPNLSNNSQTVRRTIERVAKNNGLCYRYE